MESPAGLLAVSDPIKASTPDAIRSLHQLGLKVLMLTGDNAATARSVATQLGIDEFQAGVRPEQKQARVQELRRARARVAMAGDGINDAPALAEADVGIAMGTGTDVAIESAGVTLRAGDLRGIVRSVLLSRAVMRNIRQNLFFAFVYNVLGVPIAAGVLYPVFGWLLSPMLAAAAMSLSSVSVIANSLRLRNTAAEMREPRNTRKKWKTSSWTPTLLWFPSPLVPKLQLGNALPPSSAWRPPRLRVFRGSMSSRSKRNRCPWAQGDQYVAYHDRSGACRCTTTAAVRDADPRRRAGRAELDHDPAEAGGLPQGVRRLRRAKVARYDAREVATLLAMPGIVRNRLKIEAAVRERAGRSSRCRRSSAASTPTSGGSSAASRCQNRAAIMQGRAARTPPNPTR